MPKIAISGQQVRDVMTFHAVTVGPDDTVKDAMSPTPIEIGPDAPVPEAARLMVDYGIHHLAVTEHRHRFLGIVSSLDVLRAVL